MQLGQNCCIRIVCGQRGVADTKLKMEGGELHGQKKESCEEKESGQEKGSKEKAC